MKKTRIEKVGSIYIEIPDTLKQKKKHGAEYLRRLVAWMDGRPEYLNEDKTHLDLIVEYNTRNK